MNELKPHFRAIALRIQQLAEQGGSPNTKIEVLILSESGTPRHTSFNRSVIEPKHSNLDWLLRMAGENPNGGMVIKVRDSGKVQG